MFLKSLTCLLFSLDELHSSYLGQKLKSEWTKIYYQRWKFKALRSISDGNQEFKTNLLIDIVNIQKNLINELENRKGQIIGEQVKIEQDISKKMKSYRSLEAKYYEDLSNDQSTIYAQILVSGLDLADLNLMCLDPLSNVLSCQEEVGLISTELNTENSTIEEKLKKSLGSMLFAARILYEEQSTKLDQSNDLIQDYLSERDKYSVDNNYQNLQANMDSIQQSYQALEVELDGYKKQKSEAEAQLKEFRELKTESVNSLSNINSQISEISKQIAPKIASLKPFCASQEAAFAVLLEIEKSLNNFFEIKESPVKRESVCEISL